MLKRLFLLLAIHFSALPAWAMDLAISGSTVTMSGDVMRGDCDKLKEILKSNAIELIVLGDSNGGDVNTGFCVGETIRERKLSTLIRGVCVSSCSRMWLGGVSRKLEGDNSAVGLHGNYINGYLIEKSTNRLREWIPRFAPDVDVEFMNRWTALVYSRNMMYFYNNRVLLCLNGRRDCESFRGRNVFNAGLATE